MTPVALGELNAQSLHSAFPLEYEVRPHFTGSWPSVTHQTMKYKLAEWKKRKSDVLAWLLKFMSLSLTENSSATRLNIPHRFYLWKEYIVLFACHISFIKVILWGENMEHLDSWKAVLQHLSLKRENYSAFSDLYDVMLDTLFC